MTNGDSVFNPKKCDIPDVPPIDPIPDLEDCDVPLAPDPITDCPNPPNPSGGAPGPPGTQGATVIGPVGAVGGAGADGQDGQDGQDGVIGVDGATDLAGCCAWVWVECDVSLTESASEPGIDLNCPKEDTCINAPGKWVLNDNISDPICDSVFPPCDVGKYYGETKIDCDCEPGSVTVSTSELGVQPPQPEPPKNIEGFCTDCCEQFTLFDQMVITIPTGWDNGTCGNCEGIASTYILQQFDGPVFLNPDGDVFSGNCPNDICVQWKFDSGELLCTVTGGDPCPGDGESLRLVIELTLACAPAFPSIPGRCQWRCRIIVVKLDEVFGEFDPFDCPYFCEYRLNTDRINRRDCTEVATLSFDSKSGSPICGAGGTPGDCIPEIFMEGP